MSFGGDQQQLGCMSLALDAVSNSTVDKLEREQAAYRETLAQVTEQQLSLLHSMNMQDLEALRDRIKETVKYLPVTEELKFQGRATYKTDAQRSLMEHEMRRVVQEDEDSDDDVTRMAEPSAVE